MVRRRAAGGAIVNVASTMGLGGTAHYAPYVASKWALRGLTRTAALELGRDHIRVNTIHPGVMATSFIHEPAAGAVAAIADASVSHLPDHIRRAIEITPAAGTRERIIDITTLGRRSGRARRIDPGTIRPTRLEDWADSRLMRISFAIGRDTSG